MKRTDRKVIKSYSSTPKNVVGKEIDDDVLVFVHDNTGSKEKLRLIKGAGAGKEAVECEGRPLGDERAAFTLGGLAAGTSLKGMSPTEVIEAMLTPELAPYLSYGTVEFSKTPGYTIKEVGTVTPKKSDYEVEATTTKVIGNDTYVAENQVTDSLNKNSSSDFDFNTETDEEGQFIAEAKATYSVGSNNAKTSKGSNTRKIGGTKDARVLEKNATVNSLISQTYKVYGLTKSSNNTNVSEISTKHTIKYRYCMYATTAIDNGAAVLTKQAVTDNTSIEATVKGGTGIAIQIAIPTSWTLVSIEEDSALGYQNNTSMWTGADNSTSMAIAGDNNSASYKVWTRNGELPADAKIKVTFTR